MSLIKTGDKLSLMLNQLTQDEATNAQLTHELSVVKEQLCKTLETLQIQEEDLKRRKEQVASEMSAFAKDAAQNTNKSPNELDKPKENGSLTACDYELKVSKLMKDHLNIQTRLRDELLSKQSEMENLKFELTYSEKTEKQTQIQLEKANEKLDALTSQLQYYQEIDVDQLKAYILIIEKDREELAAKYRRLAAKSKDWMNALSEMREKFERINQESQTYANQNAELHRQLNFLESQLEKRAEEKRFLIDVMEDLETPKAPQVPPSRREKKSMFWLSKKP